MKPIFARRSWHRRLYEWTYFRHPERIAICPYFWSVVFTVLTYPFRRLWRIPSYDTKETIYTVLGLGFLGLMGVIGIGAVYLMILTIGLFQALFGAIIIVGIIAVISLAGLGFIKALEVLDEYMESHRKPEVPRPPETYRPRQPNILWQFLKAKKEKICPYVEWRD